MPQTQAPWSSHRPTPADPGALLRRLEPNGWLGHRTRPAFLPLAARAAETDPRELAAFFAARGLERPQSARGLLALDIQAIAHATSFLFSGDAEPRIARLLPAAVAGLLAEDPSQLDHLGIEVFGRLDWYVAALGASALPAGLRMTRCRVFPSVQVRRVLSDDPQLSGVRIARLRLESAGRALHLELFEVGQHWLRTAGRQLALFEAAAPGPVGSAEPHSIAHLALRVRHWETVDAVHRLLAAQRGSCATATLYQRTPSHNPDDRSLNTKFLPGGEAAAGPPPPMIELISYGYAPGAGDRSPSR